MEKSVAWVRVGVTAGALILLIGAGFRHAFGIFLPPITEDLGWGREVFALGFAVQMLLLGVGSPLAGMISDRFGAARVLAFGAVLQALGLAGVSLAGTPGAFLLSAGVLIGVGAAAVSNVVVIGAVGRMVGPDWLSRSVGFLMAGASLGQIMMLPAAHLLLSAYGWHVAMVVLGGLALLALPLALVIGLGARSSGSQKPRQRVGEALQEARGHSGYLLLAAGFFVCGFHVFFLATHLPAYVQDLGLEPVVGANALMLIGLFNVFGVNTWGYLGDRRPKRLMLGIIYFSRSVVISLFLLAPPSALAVYLFASAMGFLWLGTVPLTSGIVRGIFGPSIFPCSTGWCSSATRWGGSWAPGWRDGCST